MKNVMVSPDDEVHRALMAAAERGTSLSALVREFLVELDSGETERLKEQEHGLCEHVKSFRASDRISRAELHRRDP